MAPSSWRRRAIARISTSCSRQRGRGRGMPESSASTLNGRRPGAAWTASTSRTERIPALDRSPGPHQVLRRARGRPGRDLLRPVRPGARVPRPERRGQVDDAIDACGLGDRRDEVIGRLSRGLRQRVGLAQAIVHQPEALILDEPTAGLDPGQTRETRDLIKQLGRDRTVVLSSHILSEVEATCERVLIINEGRLVADGAPGKLAQRIGTGRKHEVELVVRGDTDDVEAALREVDGVDALSSIPTDSGVVRVVVSTRLPDLREALSRAVIEGGFGLLEVQARTLSLEDIFLQLTRSEDAS